jgi:hypothetical protein
VRLLLGHLGPQVTGHRGAGRPPGQAQPDDQPLDAGRELGPFRPRPRSRFHPRPLGCRSEGETADQGDPRSRPGCGGLTVGQEERASARAPTFVLDVHLGDPFQRTLSFFLQSAVVPS